MLAFSVLSLPTVAAATVAPKHWGAPRFAGKSVLVTGGDSGIGLAAVEAFYYECARVMMIGHDEEKTRAAAANLTALPAPLGCPSDKPAPALKWLAIDVRELSSVETAVASTMDAFGSLDVAVNNAGSAGPPRAAGLHQIGDDDFPYYFNHSLEMSVNVKGTLLCMHAQIALWLKAASKGSTLAIVNVASVCGEAAFCGPAYTTSKWGEIGFSKQAASHYAGKGIRVNVLAPGPVNTPMLRGGLAEDDPRWLARKFIIEKSVPMGRIAEPWEMAGPVTFLSSDASSYVTGVVVTADGGMVNH